MKIKLAALILLLVAWPISQLEGQQSGQINQAPKFLLHLDLQKTGQSVSGKRLADSLLAIPSVAKQLEAIPESLSFLKEADLQSIGWYVDGGQEDVDVLLEITGDIDREKLVGMLAHASGYAKVQSEGIDVHHWVTDFDSMTDQFIGLPEADDEEFGKENPDSVFLAMPSEDRLLVSTTLARMTSALSGVSDYGVELNAEVKKRFGDGDNLFSLQLVEAEMGLPGNLTAVIREDRKGKLKVRAEIEGRNEADLLSFKMVEALVNDPSAAAGMFAVVKNPNVAEQKNLDETEPSAESFPVPRSNWTFAVNPAGPDKGDWGKLFTRILEDCVECRLEGDVLALDVEFVMGGFRWFELPQAEEVDYRTQVFVLNLFTTQKEFDAAVRVAEKAAGEIDRR